MNEGMGRRRRVNADEQDIHGPWRHVYAYTKRAGVTAKVKRLTRRRERAQAKQRLRREDTA